MNENEAHISEIGITLKRQLKAMIYTSGPVLALVLGIALGLPDSYRSQGVIRIDQSTQDDSRAAVDTYAEYYVQTLTAQVFSDQNLDQWIQEYGEYSDELGWTAGKKRNEMRNNLATTIVTTPVIDPRLGREREVVTGFEVTYDSRSPGQAQKIANAAVNAFLVVNRQTRRTRGEEQIEFFKSESEAYRMQISEVEARLADFKEKNARRLPDLVQVNMNALERVERDLETVQLQIDTKRQQRVILQSQLDQIPSTSDESIQQLTDLQKEYVRVSSIYHDTHPDVIKVRRQIEILSQSVDSVAAIPLLQQQQDEIASQLASARERYSEDHPNVRALLRSETTLRDRIAALRSRSESETRNVISTNDSYVAIDTQLKAIDTEITGLNTRIADLRNKRQEYEDLLMQTPQVEAEIQDLMRDLENARNLYEEIQEKQRAAEISLNLTRGSQGETLILAQLPAVPGAPNWPPRAAIIVLGFVLALGAGVGVATLRETSSGAIKGSRDVFDLCGAPPIALIPTIHNRSSRVRQRMIAAGFTSMLVIVACLAFLGANTF